MILVTGGAGFIGGNFRARLAGPVGRDPCHQPRQAHLRRQPGEPGQPSGRRTPCVRAGRHRRPAHLVARLLAEHRPRAVINFAAESHVDRSIHGAGDFIQTNIVGTFNLLEAVRATLARSGLPQTEKPGGLPLPACEHRRGLRQRCAQTTPPSPRPIATSPTAPTRPARPPATTWCAPGTTPTACRCSPPTAATTTGRTISPRS